MANFFLIPHSKMIGLFNCLMLTSVDISITSTAERVVRASKLLQSSLVWPYDLLV